MNTIEKLRSKQTLIDSLYQVLRGLKNVERISSSIPSEYKDKQVDMIIGKIESEIKKQKIRFHIKSEDTIKTMQDDNEKYPEIRLPLPDGSVIKATAVDDDNFPAINIDYERNGKESERVAFVEYNPERGEGEELCIGVYCAGNDEPDYYKSYNDKSWNERFDLVELSLKFGRVFIENPNSLEERDRIKIYDSRKRYLEYLPLCSVCVPIENYFNTVIETFKRMNSIDEFLDYIGVDSRTVSDKWSNLLEDMYGVDGYSYNPNNDKYYCLDNGREITEKTLLENEYVNFIGNQYVLITW